MRIQANWAFAVIMSILLLMAQRVLWWSHDGFPADADLARAISVQTRLNRVLTRKNRLLYSEVASLEHGTAAVEQHARTDLDFVRPGETFYAVVHPRDSKHKFSTAVEHYRRLRKHHASYR